MITKLFSLRNSISRKLRSTSKGRKRSSKKKGKDTVSVGIIGQNSIISKLILVLIISAFFLITVDFLKFYIQFSFDNYPDYQSTDYMWDGEERMNVLIIGIDKKDTGHVFVDYASVVHINPGSPSLGIFSINPKFETEMPDGSRSTIRLSYLKGLENEDELGYVISSVENLVGIKVQKYVLIDNNQAKVLFEKLPVTNRIEIEEDIVDPDFETIYASDGVVGVEEKYNYLATDIEGEDEKLKRNVEFLRTEVTNFLNPLNLLKYKEILNTINESTYTNLDKGELIRIASYIRGLRQDQLIVAYTEEKSGIKSETDANRWFPVLEDIDADLKSILVNQKVRLEQGKIEVLNASKQGGVASSKARWIENIGGRVIRVGNSPDDYTQNFIFVKNPELYPETIREIESAFNYDIKVLREEYPSRHVGDIIVVIGGD